MTEPDDQPNPPTRPTDSVYGPNLEVGHLLGGRYELLRPIATGGMARVWEARDRVLGRTVAVKVLHPHLATDRGFLLRFRREAVAAARLSHRSIVAIYDTVSEDGNEAIVMELISGHTLRELLDRVGRVSAADAVEIGSQISEALAEAHSAGVVHRDIKPSNILLCADRRVMVTDFGIAKAGEDTDLTVTGTLLGTAKYLAPEQVAGDAVDPRTDLYALGVVLFEALAGTPPFKADTDAATALARLHSAAPSLAEHRPDLGPRLIAVVDRLLSRSPADRFQRALDVRAALSVAAKSAMALDDEVGAAAEGSAGAPSDPTIIVDEWGRRPGHPGAAPGVGTPGPTSAPATADPGVRPPPVPPVDDHAWTDDQPWEDDDAEESFLRSERSWLVPTLALALVATALVVAVALFTRPLDGQSSLEDPSPLESTGNTVSLNPTVSFGAPSIASALDFDPFGDDGRERPEDVAKAIDGDDDTYWPTTTYDDVGFAGLKPGVGLILTLESPSQISDVRIRTSTDDFRIEIYVGDAFGADPAAWGEAAAVLEGNGTESAGLDARGSAVLLWITEPGVSENAAGAEVNRLQLREVELS